MQVYPALAPKFENSTRDPIAYGQAQGLEVHLPAPTELLLDLDIPAAEQQCAWMIRYLQVHVSAEITVRYTTSKSGNRHAYVTLKGFPDLTPMARIALQAVLGSDPKRELLSILHVLRQDGIPPTVLYEVPEKRQYLSVMGGEMWQEDLPEIPQEDPTEDPWPLQLISAPSDYQ